VKQKTKKLEKQIHKKFNDISADENKKKEITAEHLFKHDKNNKNSEIALFF
jgi:hypothetical protein